MGLLPQVRAAHVDSRRLTFLDVDGVVVGEVRPETVTGGVEGRDVELRRGDLTAVLHDAVRDDVEFRFDDSIATLTEHADGVDVTFESGARRNYDLVVGADGLHSRTRSLAFGPEEGYHRYLGRCFAGFTMPDDLVLAHDALSWSTHGRGRGALRGRRCHRAERAAELRAPSRPSTSTGIRPRSASSWPPSSPTPGGGRRLRALVPLRQGSSLALAGAYVLAGELAATDDHVVAFAPYEQQMRGFVDMNQALADGGRSSRPANAGLRDPGLLPGDERRELGAGAAGLRDGRDRPNGLVPHSRAIPRAEVEVGEPEHSRGMTISDLLSITGAVAGVVVLVLMAAVPFLLALPLPGEKRAAAAAPLEVPVVIPAQRTAADAPARHRAAA